MSESMLLALNTTISMVYSKGKIVVEKSASDMTIQRLYELFLLCLIV